MRERIAIVGTGIAGLGCAWGLRQRADLTLLEAQPRPGGHTNTVRVREGDRDIPIDTGFIVFNRVTYPNLCRLFEELGVAARPSEMSFSVQHLPTNLEYNGMGLNKVFAQRRSLLRPKFIGFLREIGRFFELALQLIASNDSLDVTVRDFVNDHGFSNDFLEFYLIPMSSAVWSTEPEGIRDFPVGTLIHFFRNHGFLGVKTHHPWLTVEGGSSTYVERILDQVGAPKLGSAVVSVTEGSEGADVRLADGNVLRFDRVILAAHADQSLGMLTHPRPEQAELLQPFRYQKNEAILHTDASIMPRRRLAWASWNYRVDKEAPPTVHYWMNALQGVPRTTNYFVSLNARPLIDPAQVKYETVYEHPIFTRATTRAQADLPTLNRRGRDQRVFFCGSYFRYGFHEDAYASAVSLLNDLP